jgi:hypothetical protein
MTTNYTECPKGDRWIQTVTVSVPDQPAFSWTGITARCQLRKAADDSLVKTLTPTADLTVTGKATFIVELTGSETDALALGDVLMGDLVLARTSPTFGPHTPILFAVKIVRRFTLPA